jgi:hypothetical protein
LAAVACKPSPQKATIASAEYETTKKDRGECIARFSDNTVRVRFKEEFQGNMGRVHGNAMTYEEGLGFNYGDKNNSDLLVTWCRQNECVKVEAGQGFIQLWKHFAQNGAKKLSIELFPNKTPYEMHIVLGSEIQVAKCPQWDDK